MRLEHLLSGAWVPFLWFRVETVRLVRLVYYVPGGLAQLARASALQAEGQRFESVILHYKEIFDMLDIKSR